MSNNFLFYSNYCQHSKRFLEQLNKAGLQNTLSMCCIDDPNINLPPFVQSVPTLYLSNERKVLVDDDLFTWLNNIVGQQNSQSSTSVLTNADITGSIDIMAFHKGEMGSSFSDNYSFISEGSEKTAMHHSYSYLNDNPETLPSFTKMGDTENSTQSSGIGSMRSEKSASLDKAFEQLMQQRNSERASNVGQMRI